MLADPDGLIREFTESATTVQLPGVPHRIQHELLPAPHRQPGLKQGFAAVYVFSLSTAYGSEVPAGPGRVLKVGKVGANSDARFRSQHYGFSAGSTLAKSIVAYEILWPWLGIEVLSKETVKSWMVRNLDRDHFFIPHGKADVVGLLEVFIRAKVGSVYEGAA